MVKKILKIIGGIIFLLLSLYIFKNAPEIIGKTLGGLVSLALSVILFLSSIKE